MKEREATKRAENMAEGPKISIIVPVYNTEDSLAECLVSAAFQSLPEAEVIVVNDASPDDSQRIIDRFIELFPDRVRCVVHEQNGGLSAARLTGVRNARAPYVVFLDSDDFINGKLCQALWEQSEGHDYDILFYAMDWYNIDTKRRRTISPPRDGDVETLVRKGLASFSGAMFRREFLLENRDIAFQKMSYEDAAVMPVLIGRAREIGVCPTSLYFYNLGRGDSITTVPMSRQKMDDLFRSDVLPMENIAEELRPALVERVIDRAVGSARKFPEIYDYSVRHVKRLVELSSGYEDSLLPGDRKLFEQICALPEEIRIPKRVYVNGFMREQVRDFDRYLEQAAGAYLFDPEVVVLDENTCDMAALPAWLRTASEEDKGVYFALRRIGEEGGVYVSPAVTVTKAFNREAFSGAFFVAGPNTLVLPIAFGGESGNRAFLAALEALDEGPAEGAESLTEIVSAALIGECGVHLNGKDEHGLHDLHMLHYKHVSREIQQESGYCELNYDNLRAVPEDAVVLPRALYDMAWEAARSELAYNADQIAGLRKELKDVNVKLKKLRKKHKKTAKELKSIKRSRAWKLIVKLRRVKSRVLGIFKHGV